MSDKIITYTPAYQEECFQSWYAAGRPNKSTDIIDVIPFTHDEHRRKPLANVISKWRDELGWDWRADDLDAKVAAQSEDFLITQKVLMLKEQAARARQVQVMGFDHLLEHGFDSSSSAVSAIIKGAELERTSKGLESMLEKIAKLSDADLLKKIKEIQGKLSAGQTSEIILDGDTVSGEEE